MYETSLTRLWISTVWIIMAPRWTYIWTRDFIFCISWHLYTKMAQAFKNPNEDKNPIILCYLLTRDSTSPDCVFFFLSWSGRNKWLKIQGLHIHHHVVLNFRHLDCSFIVWLILSFQCTGSKHWCRLWRDCIRWSLMILRQSSISKHCFVYGPSFSTSHHNMYLTNLSTYEA